MSSFAVYAGLVLWVFAARTPLRAWIGIAAPTALWAAAFSLRSWSCT